MLTKVFFLIAAFMAATTSAQGDEPSFDGGWEDGPAPGPMVRPVGMPGPMDTMPPAPEPPYDDPPYDDPPYDAPPYHPGGYMDAGDAHYYRPQPYRRPYPRRHRPYRPRRRRHHMAYESSDSSSSSSEDEYCERGGAMPSHEGSAYPEGGAMPSHEGNYGGAMPSHNNNGYGGAMPSHEGSAYPEGGAMPSHEGGYGGAMPSTESAYGSGYGDGGGCAQDGNMVCSGQGFNTCDHGSYVYRACAPGTACKNSPDTMILCDYA